MNRVNTFNSYDLYIRANISKTENNTIRSRKSIWMARDTNKENIVEDDIIARIHKNGVINGTRL